MIFNHIKIDPQRLQDVLSRADYASSTNGSTATSGTGGARTGVVSEAVIVATRDISCNCENPDYMASIAKHVGYTYLHAGMPLRGPGSLFGFGGLGSGCTHPRYVCPRLVKVRSRYGG